MTAVLPSAKGDSLLQDVLEHITTVIHVLTIGLCAFILHLCRNASSTDLLTWHVALYTVGVSFHFVRLHIKGVQFFEKLIKILIVAHEFSKITHVTSSLPPRLDHFIDVLTQFLNINSQQNC